MTQPISDIAFTPAVKRAQQERGSRELYGKVESRGGWRDRVTADLVAFIAERDSLYLGTANAAGQPYIQYRGGAKGFLKVLDDRTLALADGIDTVVRTVRCCRRSTLAVLLKHVRGVF